MHRLVYWLLAVLFLFPVQGVFAESYQYMTAEQLKTSLENSQPVILLDIQVEEEFVQHHLPGALATYAYPVTSAEETGRIDATLETLSASEYPVVVVCPRGGGGAKRAYDHLKEKGITLSRLFILEGGQQKWPYAEWVRTGH